MSGPRGRLQRDESGQLAGIEVLPFGFLVFVVVVLLVANAWAVVDAKIAVVAAAREATRAYVETPPGGDPMARAEAAAREAIQGAGRDAERVTVVALAGDLSRCAEVRFEASYTVPALRLPWIGGFGSFTASARHGEIVDPYRNGLTAGGRRCDAGA